MKRESPRLFCLACERVVERDTSSGDAQPACPGCGGALVAPHPDPCPECGGMLTSDGDVCVDCVPVIENVGDAKARLRRLGSSLPLLAIGIFFGWKDVASVRAGVFTRGGWRHDILRVDEPIWFWVNVSVTAVVALVCVAGAVGIVVSAITKRGSVEASVSARS